MATLARITCPNCRQPFQAPVQQILDVEVDPQARNRLLSGQLNIVGCPHCGMSGGINLPFIYYDPSKELALVYMPFEAGRDDMERQQIIGSLSRTLLNQLPREQRMGYLLNPQVFFSLESLVNRVLEAEGITPEIMEEQKAKAGLLMSLLGASTAEERSELIRDNAALINQEFFAMLQANITQASMAGREDLTERMLVVMEQLFQETEIGQQLAARTDAVQALEQEPTREKLLELLLASDDPATRATLVTLGQSLVDYLFFQMISQKIEGAKDKEESKRLEALRAELLEIRDSLQQQMQSVVDERMELVRRLLSSEQQEKLARRHLGEMDDLFFNILATLMEQAQNKGAQDLFEKYSQLWGLAMGLIREQVPPELLLVNEIVEAPDREAIRQVLENNRNMLVPQLLPFLEQAAQQMEEQGHHRPAEQVRVALEIARALVTPQEAPKAKPEPEPEKGGDEETSSGLLIARR